MTFDKNIKPSGFSTKSKFYHTYKFFGKVTHKILLFTYKDFTLLNIN